MINHSISSKPSKIPLDKNLITIFFSIAFVTFIAGCFTIRFESNDDISMLLMASGIISGEPNEHLVFIQIPIGILLKTLYSSLPQIEHYTILFLSFHCLAIHLIVRFIFKTIKSPLFASLHSISFLFFEYFILTNLQFTTTSALLTTAGLTLFYKTNQKEKILGFLIVIIGFMLRPHAAALILLLSSPLFLITQFHDTIKNLKSYLIFCGILISLYTFNHLYYQFNQNWNNYEEYNYYRGKINDNPNLISYQSQNESEEVNFQLLTNFIADPYVLDIEELKKINQRITERSLSEKIIYTVAPFFRFKYHFFVIFGISVFILLFASKKVKFIWMAAVCMLLVVSSYVSLNSFLKPRVFQSSLIPVFFLYLTISIAELKQRAICTCISLCLLINNFFLYNQNLDFLKSIDRKLPELNQQMKLLNINSATNNKRVFIMPYSLSVECISAFKISEMLKDKKIVFGGWLTSLPSKDQIKSHREFCESLSILTSKQELISLIPIISSGLKINYGRDVEIKTLFSTNNYCLVSFTEKK